MAYNTKQISIVFPFIWIGGNTIYSVYMCYPKIMDKHKPSTIQKIKGISGACLMGMGIGTFTLLFPYAFILYDVSSINIILSKGMDNVMSLETYPNSTVGENMNELANINDKILADNIVEDINTYPPDDGNGLLHVSKEYNEMDEIIGHPK